MVMFRDFAKKNADSLCIAGFARNNDDGSLTVLAHGDKEVLDRFLDVLKVGPTMSRVDSVVEEEVNVEWKTSGFDVY